MSLRSQCMVLALLGATLPSAAASRLDIPDLSRFVKWGPLRVRPGVELKNFGYDNNILVASAEPLSDYTATLAPRADGLVLFGSRAFATFSEQLELTGYLDNHNFNYTNQRGNARITIPRDNIGLIGTVVFNRLNERPVDAQDLRPLSRELALGWGIVVLPGWRTEVEVGQVTSERRYTDDDNPSIATRLDRDISRDYVEITYRLAGRSRLTLDADRRDIVFRDASAAKRNSSYWSVLPGVRFGEGGKLTGTFKAGWTEIETVDPAEPRLAEPVASAELAYRPNPRTTLRLEGARTPGYTVSGSEVFFIDSHSKIGAKVYLTRIFGIESGGGIGRLTFPGSTRLDRTRQYDLAVVVGLSNNGLGRRVEYKLGFQQYRRRSTVLSQNYSTSAIGMNAVVGF